MDTIIIEGIERSIGIEDVSSRLYAMIEDDEHRAMLVSMLAEAQSVACPRSKDPVVRHNAMRRFGHIGAIRISLFGTESSYEDNTGAQVWVNKRTRRALQSF